VLAAARLVGEPDKQVGALRHVGQEPVIADGDVDEAAHVVAVAGQRLRGVLGGSGMGGIAHDSGEALQVETRLLGEAAEHLVGVGALAAGDFQELVASAARGKEVAIVRPGEHGAAASAIRFVQQDQRGKRDGRRDGDRDAADQEDPVSDAHYANRAGLACPTPCDLSRAGGARARRGRNVVGEG
jgi:hypothetical protein